MFRSHFKTLIRHYENCGVESDSEDDDDGETKQPRSALKSTPNDIWFQDRKKQSSEGKGQAGLSMDADRYQRKYTVSNEHTCSPS